MVHNPGAVDEEDLLHQGDVLPDLGLTRNWGDFAHLQADSLLSMGESQLLERSWYIVEGSFSLIKQHAAV